MIVAKPFQWILFVLAWTSFLAADGSLFALATEPESEQASQDGSRPESESDENSEAETESIPTETISSSECNQSLGSGQWQVQVGLENFRRPSNRPVIILIDPFSSGSDLFHRALDRGYRVIVGLTAETPADESFLKDLKELQAHPEFKGFFILDGDPEGFGMDLLLGKMNQFEGLRQVQAILPGAESSVELANALSERWPFSGRALASNSLRVARSLRDKKLMQESIRAKDVPHPGDAPLRAIEGFIAKDPESVRDWFLARNRQPIVIKPKKGFGSKWTWTVHSEAHLNDALEQTFGQLDPSGEVITELLVQEYVGGDEYVVDANTFSVNIPSESPEEQSITLSQILSIWVYGKRAGKHPIYEHMTLLPPTGEVQRQVGDYALRVNRKLGVRVGPTHAEIKLDEKGPVLIEVGGRLAGMKSPRLTRQATGVDPIELVLDAYLHPGTLVELDEDLTTAAGLLQLKQRLSRPYEVNEWISLVFLQSSSPGRILNIPEGFESEYASDIAIRLYFEEGTALKETVDMDTIPGVLILSHPDRERLIQDRDAILERIRRDDFAIERS